MANPDLSPFTDDEKAALAALLKRTIGDDRYPLSPRIGTLQGILATQEGAPKPAPVPLPSRRNYASPRHTAAQRRAR